jgi:hypothetical protein
MAGASSDQKLAAIITPAVNPNAVSSTFLLGFLAVNTLALQPDGKLLVTSGRTNALVVIETETGKIVQQVTLSTNKTEPHL